MTDNPTNEAPERIYIADELTDAPKDRPFIVAMSNDEWSKEYADDPDFYDTVEYIRADLAQPDLCAVVKPLEWINKNDEWACAETPFGNYHVQYDDDTEAWWASFEGTDPDPRLIDPVDVSTKQDAVDIANADWASLIASLVSIRTAAEVREDIIAKIQTRIDTLTPAMSPEEDAACLELEKLVRAIREGR